MNGASSGRHSARQLVRRLGPLGLFAVLASMGTLVLLCIGASRVARAAMVWPSEPGAREADEKERAERFAAAFDGRLAQFRGRSMFFLPPEPPPPPPPPSEPTEHGSGPQSKPTSYAGPAIIAMVNDTVWFDDGRRLDLGEDDAAGLVVMSINPPWSARLRWNGVEFEVPLFDRTTPRFLTPDAAPEPAPETTPATGPADAGIDIPPAQPLNEPDEKEPE